MSAPSSSWPISAAEDASRAARWFTQNGLAVATLKAPPINPVHWQKWLPIIRPLFWNLEFHDLLPADDPVKFVEKLTFSNGEPVEVEYASKIRKSRVTVEYVCRNGETFLLSFLIRFDRPDGREVELVTTYSNVAHQHSWGIDLVGMICPPWVPIDKDMPHGKVALRNCCNHFTIDLEPDVNRALSKYEENQLESYDTPKLYREMYASVEKHARLCSDHKKLQEKMEAAELKLHVIHVENQDMKEKIKNMKERIKTMKENIKKMEMEKDQEEEEEVKEEEEEEEGETLVPIVLVDRATSPGLNNNIDSNIDTNDNTEAAEEENGDIRVAQQEAPEIYAEEAQATDGETTTTEDLDNKSNQDATETESRKRGLPSDEAGDSTPKRQRVDSGSEEK